MYQTKKLFPAFSILVYLLESQFLQNFDKFVTILLFTNVKQLLWLHLQSSINCATNLLLFNCLSILCSKNSNLQRYFIQIVQHVAEVLVVCLVESSFAVQHFLLN